MKSQWKLLIVCPHPAMSRQIRTAAGELGLEVCLLSEYPRPGTLAGQVSQQECNICFLDVSSQQEQALQLIAEAAPVVCCRGASGF